MRTKIPGFSLIEILASIVIGGLVLASVMGSYVSLSQASSRMDLSRQLQKELNFALIRIADKVRSFSVDYDAYAAGGACHGITIQSADQLCVGAGHVFRSASFTLGGTPHQTLHMNGAPLFSKRFAVQELFFATTPSLDPFAAQNLGDRSTQLQPKVTLFIVVQSIENPSVQFTVQTTISSRQYE